MFTAILLYGLLYAVGVVRIVVTNTKGGVGKTTTAMFLAAALCKHGDVEVWDIDPQGSATEWFYRVEDDQLALPFQVRGLTFPQVKRARPTADFTIIDTAPGDVRGIDTVLSNADAAIIPTGPSAMDISRVWATEEVTSTVCPSYVLLTQADMRTRAPQIAMRLLDEAGVGHFETVIPLRESLRQAYGTVPDPTNLYGYDHVANEVLEALHG